MDDMVSVKSSHQRPGSGSGFDHVNGEGDHIINRGNSAV